MTLTKRSNWFSYAPYAIWLFFSYFCLRYAIEIANGGNSWKTGDWLINYSAGPIRRGLTGTLFLSISDLGLPLLWVTYVAQVSLYAVIFSLVLKLYKSKERGSFWLLILFSPAFLLFPFYDIQGGFRKEIIVFTAFTFLCVLYAQKTMTHPKLIFASFLYGVAAFSHELTIFTLPFFFYLIYISLQDGLINFKVAISYAVIFAAVSATAFIFAYIFKGDAVAAAEICLSLTNRNLDPSICNGAISSLSQDTQYAQSRVINSLSAKSVYTPALFLLSLLPLTFTTWWRRRTFILLIAGLITIFPLFVVAIDWGRWIHIQVFMLFCLALAERVTVKFPYKTIFLLLGLAYLSTWSIPHCCVGGIRVIFGKIF